MILYTLQGPTSTLEIYRDHMRLVKKPWMKIFVRRELFQDWPINELARFEIANPSFLFFSGRLEWATFNGDKGFFHFKTNLCMMRKIESYLQKRVVKNHEKRHSRDQNGQENQEISSAVA